MSEYLKGVARELVLGDFDGGQSTAAGTIGNIAIGFIPIVGQVADVRDTAAAIKEVGTNYKDAGAWLGLGIAVAAWIPTLDSLKSTKALKESKALIKGGKIGKKTRKSVIRKIGLEDRKTFHASKDFFKRYKWLFGENHGWSLEHLAIKQRFYRSSSKIRNAQLKKSKFNRLLQMVGDGGINLVPIPKKFNTWLYHHNVASIFFTIGCYATAVSFVYGSMEFARKVEGKLDDFLFNQEVSAGYDKKIIRD